MLKFPAHIFCLLLIIFKVALGQEAMMLATGGFTSFWCAQLKTLQCCHHCCTKTVEIALLLR